MTLIIAAKFSEDSKERAIILADSCETYSDGKTDHLGKKIDVLDNDLIIATAGDLSDKTFFKEKAGKELSKCSSLDDVYSLLSEKFPKTFNKREFQICFMHAKDARILVYEPPPNKVLSYEEKYVILGSASEAPYSEFAITYKNQDWRDNFPTLNEILELSLKEFYKASFVRSGEVKLPIDVYLTKPLQYKRIDDNFDIWREITKIVKEETKPKGINLPSFEKVKSSMPQKSQ